MAKAKKTLSMILSFIFTASIMLGTASAAAKVVYAKVALKTKPAATYETGKTVQFSVTAANVSKVQYRMSVLNASKKKEEGKYGSLVAGKAVTTLKYVPKVAGAYTITVYAKATGSKKTYDSYITVKFTAKAPAKPQLKVVELAPLGEAYGFLNNPTSLSLPSTVGVTYSNGTTEDLEIVWDQTADELVAEVGEKEATGTVKGATGLNKVTVTVIIDKDPQLENIIAKVNAAEAATAKLDSAEAIAAAESAITAAEKTLIPVADDVIAVYQPKIDALKAKVADAKAALAKAEEAYQAKKTEVEKNVAAFEAVAKGDLSTMEKVEAALKAVPSLDGMRADDAKAFQARVDAATKTIYDAQKKIEDAAKAEAKKVAIAAAEEAIAKLPAVDKLTVTDEEVVKAARLLVRDANQKGAADSEVKGVDTLEKLEAKMVELIAEAADNAVKKPAAIKAAVEAIAALPTADKLVLADKAKVEAARTLVADAAKVGAVDADITNLDTLKAAEAKIVELEKVPVNSDITSADIVTNVGALQGLMTIKVNFPAGVTDVKVVTVDGRTFPNPYALANGVGTNVAATFTLGTENTIVLSYVKDGATKEITIKKMAEVYVAPSIKAENVETKTGSLPGTIAVKVTFPAGISNVKITAVDGKTFADPVILENGMFKNVAGDLVAGANKITLTFTVNGQTQSVEITK